jgi:hypothetical protein
LLIRTLTQRDGGRDVRATHPTIERGDTMRFHIDNDKTLEAILYIVSRYGEVGRFHALKSLYFADRFHLRKYGRPITGDTYIAMDSGPIPAHAAAILKQKVPKPERQAVADALVPGINAHHPTYKIHREPDLSYFSKTDLECLDEGFKHCFKRSFGSISDETHHHLAWKNADRNGEMAVEDLLDGVDESIRADAETFAAYGVL